MVPTYNNNNNNNNIYSCQKVFVQAVSFLFKHSFNNTSVVTRKGQSSRLVAHPPVVAESPS